MHRTNLCIHRKTIKTLTLFAAILFTACGGSGTQSNNSTTPTPSAPPTKETVSVQLSAEISNYEILDTSETILVTAQFSAVIPSMSTSHLSASNASVAFLSLIDQSTYQFSVVPDGSGQDVELLVPSNAVTSQGGLLNSASNTLIINAVDTIAPQASLEYSVLSYTEESALDTLSLNITLSEDIAEFDAEYITLENAELSDFTRVSTRQLTALVTSTQRENDIIIEIAAGVFSDNFGNTNAASNRIALSASPISPEEMGSIQISTQLRSLTFSWESVKNATYYQLYATDAGQDNLVQVGSNIDKNQLSVSVTPEALFKEAGKEYSVRPCNSIGCGTDSERLNVTEHLWNAAGYLKAPKAFSGQTFGSSVALSRDGKVMAVSAVNDGLESNDAFGAQTENLYRAGSVYLYRKENEQWQFESLIQAPNREGGDAFGDSISLNQDGSVLAIGAYAEDGQINAPENNDIEDSGAVYIYRYNQGAWVFSNYLKADNGNTLDQFGSAVALDAAGDTLLISANAKEGSQEETLSLLAVGAIYIFEYENDSWQQQAFFQSPHQGERFFFGESLAIDASGTTAIVGMPLATSLDGSQTWSGAVHIYARKNGAWTPHSELYGTGTNSRMNFGQHVSLSDEGTTLVVSAHNEVEPNSKALDSGAVYIYQREEGSTFQLQTKLYTNNPVDFTSFGQSIALNGSGELLAISAREYSLWQPGFYLTGSPNDNRPFSSESHHLYQLQNGEWAKTAFIKGVFGGGNLAFDSVGNNLVFGAYNDNLLIDGYNALLDIPFGTGSNSLTGAVLIY